MRLKIAPDFLSSASDLLFYLNFEKGMPQWNEVDESKQNITSGLW